MKGQLQGSEYLNLTSDHQLVLWGVENMGLYLKSLEAYRAVAKGRDKYRDYLARIDAVTNTLKPAIYNPFLMAMTSTPTTRFKPRKAA